MFHPAPGSQKGSYKNDTLGLTEAFRLVVVAVARQCRSHYELNMAVRFTT
jgi:hypothetical protein